MLNEVIKTRSHSFIESLKQIRDGKDRSFLFCEGKRIIEDLLVSALSVIRIYSTAKNKSEVQALLAKVNKPSIPLSILSDQIMSYVSDLEMAPGVIAVAKTPSRTYKFLNPKSLIVILHQLQLPQNVGAIIRTCEAAGVDAVWVTDLSVYPFSPKGIRGSAGSVFRVPLIIGGSLDKACLELKSKGIKVWGLDPQGTLLFDQVNWIEPSALVMGSEAHGFSTDELKSFDGLLKIPMKGQIESLNVGTAAGICLFEAARQRRGTN